MQILTTTLWPLWTTKTCKHQPWQMSHWLDFNLQSCWHSGDGVGRIFWTFWSLLPMGIPTVYGVSILIGHPFLVILGTWTNFGWGRKWEGQVDFFLTYWILSTGFPAIYDTNILSEHHFWSLFGPGTFFRLGRWFR